ncbi:DNA-binding response regulator, NarL/FixJ family, contains REC and HTH domains [Filimonas lacunae]|uniref:DNA-binding response regulator, NarL/FixJ family, contains REC and HTH domains n=1 Tax=Filimonas lacunae TaxID=477680 RepID=A0A173MCX4_9BACT|nr:LuxR C-terminal-related transcriptional regulator [Filimonas lacunae]BAV05370.1 two-component transcriptional regulator, LuxR family [Filimonas lacunae]SIT21669.1 DNA-binding response regulator, NarL/FixJ family, contains REC and HTH domains [Filimonas lacunae]
MKNRELPLTIGIADDDANFVNALKDEIIKDPQHQISFCAPDGGKLLELYNVNDTSCLVIDLYTPFISGMEAVRLIKNVSEEVNIIAYSSTYQPDMADMLFQWNNVMYCERSIDFITRYIDDPMQKEDAEYKAYLQHWQNRTLSIISGRKKESPTEALKPVELKILALIAEGATNHEVASSLALSKRTIDTYIERLIKKLEVSNRIGLAAYAFNKGVCKLYCEVGKNGRCDTSSIFTPIAEGMHSIV